MAFRYGFYNSKNGDRKYFASDFSMLLSGLIEDGIFGNIPDGMSVISNGRMEAYVSKGLAWFDNTWNYVDAPYPIIFEESDVLYDRYDAVVIEVHGSNQERTNYIKIVKGTPASSPSKPVMETGNYTQHPLAYVRVRAGSSEITQGDIESTIGTEECPFVVGIQETASVGSLYSQWQEEFDTWFAELQTNLEGDVAANLQNQISTHVSDKTAHIPTLAHVKEGTVHKLSGLVGVEGVLSAIFVATGDYVAGDTMTLDEEAYAIQMSTGYEADSNMFVTGAAIPVIVDKPNKKLNFKSGGGFKKTLMTEVITATTQWKVPIGTTSVTVKLFGAGGGGGTSPWFYGGNGGDMATGQFDVSPEQVIPITIGAGGGGGRSGGASSFGSYLSAAGGAGGTATSGGRGAANGGASGGLQNQGSYGGKGGVDGLSPTAGTNTIGKGLEFEGRGSPGGNGTAGKNGTGKKAGDGGSAGIGGSGGYGGLGGDGGNGGRGGDGDSNTWAASDGGDGGHGGGGGYGGDGGNGGRGGDGGNTYIGGSQYGGPPGGDGGHGGGGGYGGLGGNGGWGANGKNGSDYIDPGYPGRGGNGGGGGYGLHGSGGNGGSGGSAGHFQANGGDGGDGGNGGYAAGGGTGGGGGTTTREEEYSDGSNGSPGRGGSGICILTYMGYEL